MSVCLSVLCVCVHDNSKHNGPINLKFEHIEIYKIAQSSSTLALCYGCFNVDIMKIYTCVPLGHSSKLKFSSYIHLPPMNIIF